MVAFDAVGPSGGAGVAFTASPGTWTHVNGGNGIFVGITVFTGATDTVTGVTYGGVALSKIGFTNTGASSGGVSFWGLLGPTCPTGSNTVSVSVSDPANNHNAGSVSVSAAGSSGTAFTANNAAGSTTSQAVTVNSTTTGGLIVTVACHGASGTWGLTGGTVRWSINTSASSGSDNGGGGTAVSTGGGANQTLTWTETVADEWGIVAVEVLPAASTPPDLAMATRIAP